MNGLDIVQRVYTRLRKPSQQALPYQQVLDMVREVITRKKLDLALSEQNQLATASDWFTAPATDFALEDLGISVLLPIRVETRTIDSEFETGDNVPIVNYAVLDTSIVGACSFYGEPIRMVLRDHSDYVLHQQYRLIYESDFEEDVTLESYVGLPLFFGDMVVVESAFQLLLAVEDSTKEWLEFMKMAREDWIAQIADKRQGWDNYVRTFKGRAQVPKRTFFQNQRPRHRTRFFKE